jgi:hypothetical protein
MTNNSFFLLPPKQLLKIAIEFEEAVEKGDNEAIGLLSAQYPELLDFDLHDVMDYIMQRNVKKGKRIYPNFNVKT